MTLNGIATRYALALVDALLAPSADIAPEQALEQLKAFAELEANDHDLHAVLLSPSVSAERKRRVIARIAESMGLHRLICNFLLVLNDHRRMGILRNVSRLSFQILDQRLGFVRVGVDTAAPLSEEESREVQSRLERVTGKKVRVDVRVVPDLIGGLLARVESTVYDGSVRGYLRALEERLVAGA
jgi:F-type H+-transporting ATPase subunit delta